jgi:hypothetical protein
MGAKKTLPTQEIVISGAMTGTSTVDSSAISIVNLDNVSLQFDWTGTPNGSFDVLVSNDNVTYHSLNIPNLPTATGVAGGFIVNITQLSQPWIKASYTNTSSTGTLNVTIFAKDLN